MSKAKVNDLEKRVAASVARQYVLEAKTLHMSLSTYIAWLKLKAGYSTPYDQILADYKAQAEAPHPSPGSSPSQGGEQPSPHQGQSAQAQAGAEGEGEADSSSAVQ